MDWLVGVYTKHCTIMTEQEHTRIEITNFFDALDWATECGLQYEFIEFFLRDYGNNKNVREAIHYANCEWDL